MSLRNIARIRNNRESFIRSMKLRSDIFEYVKAAAKEYGCTSEKTAAIFGVGRKAADTHLGKLVDEGYLRRRRASNRSTPAYYFPLKDGPYEYNTEHFDNQLVAEQNRLAKAIGNSAYPATVNPFFLQDGAVIKVNEYTTVYGAKNRSVPLKKHEPHIGNGSSGLTYD